MLGHQAINWCEDEKKFTLVIHGAVSYQRSAFVFFWSVKIRPRRPQVLNGNCDKCHFPVYITNQDIYQTAPGDIVVSIYEIGYVQPIQLSNGNVFHCFGVGCCRVKFWLGKEARYIDYDISVWWTWVFIHLSTFRVMGNNEYFGDP